MYRNDETIQFLNTVFDKIFPNFSVDGYLQINGKTTFGFCSNDLFTGTKFQFDFTNKKLLHFTSLNSLKSILESQSLRFSNFNSFKDEKELLLAADEIFQISDLESKKAKRGLFALSLTELEEDDVKGNYNYHWKNYGNNYKGVALELEIHHQWRVYYYFYWCNTSKILKRRK